MDIIKGNVRMIIRIGEAVLYKAFEFYTSIYHHEFFLLSFIHLFCRPRISLSKLFRSSFHNVPASPLIKSSLSAARLQAMRGPQASRAAGPPSNMNLSKTPMHYIRYPLARLCS